MRPLALGNLPELLRIKLFSVAECSPSKHESSELVTIEA